VTNDPRPVRVTISRREFRAFRPAFDASYKFGGVGEKEEEKNMDPHPSANRPDVLKSKIFFRLVPRGTRNFDHLRESRPSLFFSANHSLVIIYERACRSRQVYAFCYTLRGCIYYEALILDVKKKSRRRQRVARGNVLR